MQLRTEIEIAASPNDIWRVLTEFQHYSEWNPFIVSIAGGLEVGASLEVELSIPESRDLRLKPSLLVCEPERELRWRAELGCPWLLSGEHFFQLLATRPGMTRLVHGQNLTGILLRFLRTELAHTSRGFVYMNQALKRRAEANRGAASE